MTSLKLLALLVAINGAPILAALLLGPRLGTPMDAGGRAWDGQRWLGDAKTWRGLAAALVAGPVVAWGLGWGWILGLLAAAAGMTGDLVSSFTKRRLARPPSSRFPGLDQLPESLLPACVVGPALDMSWMEILATVVAFSLLERPLSQLLYALHIRRQPY